MAGASANLYGLIETAKANRLAAAADPHGSFDWQAEERRVAGPLRGIALVGIPKTHYVQR